MNYKDLSDNELSLHAQLQQATLAALRTTLRAAAAESQLAQIGEKETTDALRSIFAEQEARKKALDDKPVGIPNSAE